MNKGFSLTIAAVLVSTLTVTSAQASTAHDQQIKALQQIVSHQQAQIAAEQKTLKRLASRLNALESQKISVHAANVGPDVPVHLSHAHPSSRSVLKRASSQNEVTDLSRHKLVLGTQKANLSIYGQINAMAMQTEDGKRSDFFVANNRNSMTRFNIDSEFNPAAGWTLGSHLQLGLDVNPSDEVSQTSPNPSSSIDIRRAEIYVESKRFGTLLIGKGETASDNTAYSDLSGTKVLSRASMDDIGGGLFFRNSVTNTLSTTTVSNAVNGLDGFSRKMRVRYDTPSFHGFNLAGSLISGRKSDVALKYGGKLATSKLAAQIGYTSPQSISSGTNEARGNVLDTSASILFPCGFSMTGAYAKVMAGERGRKDPYYYFVKPGYQFKYFSPGLTAMSLDYGVYYNFQQNRDRAKAYGFDVVQNINAWDLALYAGYRLFQLHRPGSRFDNLNLVVAGALYKF